MKKAITLMLALVTALALSGCKSRAVKNAEALIEAIGPVTLQSGGAIAAAQGAYEALTEEEKAEVENRDLLITSRADLVEAVIADLGEITADSEDAVAAAEEAYESLSAEEKAAVQNHDVLTAARAALEEALFEQLRLSFAGEWVRLTEGAETFVTLNADGSGRILEYDAQWSLSRDGATLSLQGTGVTFRCAVSSIGDSQAVYCAEWGTMLVKKDAYPRIAEQYLVTAQVNMENLSDYVGEIVLVRNIPDEEGAESARNVFAFRSSAYADGLVFLGAGDDFLMEYTYIINPRRGQEHTGRTRNPYHSVEEQTADAAGITVTGAEGTLYYIKAELVADVSYDQASRTRVITLTDGTVIYDCCMVYSAEYAAYDYLTETDLLF